MDHGHEELSRSLILNDDESGVGIARTVPRCLVMAVHHQHHHPSSSSTPLSVFFYFYYILFGQSITTFVSKV